MVEYLLTQSVDVFLTNSSGAQALHLAASNGKGNVVDMLSRCNNINLFCQDFEGIRKLLYEYLL